jgi:hypothetical protein
MSVHSSWFWDRIAKESYDFITAGHNQPHWNKISPEYRAQWTQMNQRIIASVAALGIAELASLDPRNARAVQTEEP